MDSSFSDKLKTVLSDPEAMEKIATLAKSFAGNTAPGGENLPAPDPGEGPPPDGGIGDLLKSPAIAEALRFLSDGSRERMALLCAMRPFVKDEKKEKLDRIIQTMKTLDLLVSAQRLL